MKHRFSLVLIFTDGHHDDENLLSQNILLSIFLPNKKIHIKIDIPIQEINYLLICNPKQYHTIGSFVIAVESDYFLVSIYRRGMDIVGL